MQLSGVALLAGAVVITSVPHAAHAESFYKDKNITAVVSTVAGDAYDAVMRLLMRHMPRHIPGNPNTVVQNMPGGGYMIATNFLHNLAPKDGTTIGTVNQSVLLHQTLGGRGVQYDMRKFNWLGAFGSRNSVAVVWHTAGVKTLEDIMKKEVITGATSEGSSGYRYAVVMNNVLGTKFKLVKGYAGSSGIMLALERGEVHARLGGYTTYLVNNPDWVKNGTIIFVAQLGGSHDKELPGVPLWTDFAKTEEQRQTLQLIGAPISLGYPFLAPPGVPADRVAVLRKAFDATMNDPKFQADAKKRRIADNWLNVAQVEKIVMDTLNASPAVVAKAKAALGMKEGEKGKK